MKASQKHKRILILVEKEDDNIASITFELLRAGRELADRVGGNLCAAVVGYGVTEISHEIAHFSDEVYSLDNILFETFQVDFYAYALEKFCRSINPDIILMGHTFDNLDLAPRLAFKLGAKLITDCIHLDIEPEIENLLCTKPIYGGNAVAIFEIDRKPQIITLRPKVMEAVERNPTKGEVISFDLTIDKSLAKTESIETFLEQSVSLDKANVIVGGGRGIKTVEGLKLLYELVEVLKKYFNKVELGGSRPLVDAGLLPHSRQIGQTGEKINPQLYIAIGISGTSQHLSGVVGSKKIVAINKDGEASIFDAADYGVVGEYENIVPALIKKLGELS